MVTKRTGQPKGPPRQSAAIRQLRTGKVQPTPPVVFLTGPEKPPADLSPDAAKFWAAYSPELVHQGWLTLLDVPLFSALCECWALMESARRTLATEGHVITGTRGQQRHPAMLNYSAALLNFHSISARFGFSPDARARMAIPPADDMAGSDLLSGF